MLVYFDQINFEFYNEFLNKNFYSKSRLMLNLEML